MADTLKRLMVVPRVSWRPPNWPLLAIERELTFPVVPIEEPASSSSSSKCSSRSSLFLSLSAATENYSHALFLTWLRALPARKLRPPLICHYYSATTLLIRSLPTVLVAHCCSRQPALAHLTFDFAGSAFGVRRFGVRRFGGSAFGGSAQHQPTHGQQGHATHTHTNLFDALVCQCVMNSLALTSCW